MIINSNGIEPFTIETYLGYWTAQLKEKFGSDFVIKAQSFISNLATTSSFINLGLEQQIEYLAKQLNPYTAEGIFQDALYALIGLVRRFATYTVVQRTIQGVAGTECAVGSIRIQNKSTKDIFVLNSAVTIGSDGLAVGSFTAVELGAIDLSNDSFVEIIDAPSGINSVYYATGNVIELGDDYEDDSEFRMRWLSNQSLANSATKDGMRKALENFVENPKDLNVVQNRTNSTVNGLPPHTMQVVIYSAESNETIAQAIFDHLLDGVLTYGTTTVEVEDSSGTKEDISFTRATVVPIYFKVTVKIKNGYTMAQINIPQVIVDNFDLSLGEKVIANNYIEYINDIDGVDYIEDIKVSENGTTWVAVDVLEYNEIASVDKNNITVIGAS